MKFLFFTFTLSLLFTVSSLHANFSMSDVLMGNPEDVTEKLTTRYNAHCEKESKKRAELLNDKKYINARKKKTEALTLALSSLQDENAREKEETDMIKQRAIQLYHEAKKEIFKRKGKIGITPKCWGFLNHEQIGKLGEELEAKEAKLKYTFKPDNIRNIVVGCNLKEHEIHFWGGRYTNERRWYGEITHDGRAISSSDSRKIKEYYDEYLYYRPLLDVNKTNEENRKFMECRYIFGDLITGEWKYETFSKKKALEFAQKQKSRSELHPCEVDPQKTIYINRSYTSEGLNHIHGDFESIPSLSFLTKVNKIIIEYNSGRNLANFRNLIQNAHNILIPGGELLLELDLRDDFELSDIDAIFLEIGFENIKPCKEIPGRGSNRNAEVYTYRVQKK